VAGHTPASVGESAEWAVTVNAAQENGANHDRALRGKTLFSVQNCTYTIILHELRAVLKASILAGQTNSPKATGQQTMQEDGFPEVRKRPPPNETAGTSKKAAVQDENVARLKHSPPQAGRHSKLFRPFRATNMNTDSSGTETTSNEEAVPDKTGTPPLSNPNVYDYPDSKKTLSSVALETEPESSREAWRISNPSDPTSTSITCPSSYSIPNPKNSWRW
jgi:hypothetical protein